MSIDTLIDSLEHKKSREELQIKLLQEQLADAKKLIKEQSEMISKYRELLKQNGIKPNA